MFNKFLTMLKGGSGTDKNSVYVCKGGCGARLSEEEYKNHPTKVCGADDCTNKGKPFVRKEHEDEGHCEHCNDACQHCSS